MGNMVSTQIKYSTVQLLMNNLFFHEFHSNYWTDEPRDIELLNKNTVVGINFYAI